MCAPFLLKAVPGNSFLSSGEGREEGSPAEITHLQAPSRGGGCTGHRKISVYFTNWRGIHLPGDLSREMDPISCSKKKKKRARRRQRHVHGFLSQSCSWTICFREWPWGEQLARSAGLPSRFKSCWIHRGLFAPRGSTEPLVS